MEHNRLDPATLAAFEPDAKVGLLATVDDGGRPHVSLITSLAGKDENHLVWGQFCEGQSKRNVRGNPKVGFLVMTLDRKLWRGKATWTHAATEGEDYVAFNKRPMFRYNAYFGIHTVHYMDLVSVSSRMGLPLPGMLAGAAGSLLPAGLTRSRGRSQVFNTWTRSHLSKVSTLKFLAWVGADGHPLLVPCVPGRPAGSDRFLFAPSVFRKDLRRLKKGTQVAVFALNLDTESVLLRGSFAGYRGIGPARMGLVEVDWVYNSMPPVPGQIHPSVPLSAVTSF